SNHNVSEVMNQEDSSKTVESKYYTFRIRKRDLHGLALVLPLWFLWSEGAEIGQLFGNLFETLR
ncbi:hypothetical protein, partial [Pseudomonas sp. K5]|uniref:hypothetical protein n=1 Tax=Pseudomonas sp. K5 TaxID=1156313 RepID=UPI001D02423E